MKREVSRNESDGQHVDGKPVTDRRVTRDGPGEETEDDFGSIKATERIGLLELIGEQYAVTLPQSPG